MNGRKSAGYDRGRPFGAAHHDPRPQLTKSYTDLRRGQIVALGGISFHARPGQIYGLLGPNGAGKTTALRILSTVLRPSGGTAAVNGFDVLTQPAQVRRQIGYVSANTAVYDRMTGWETVEYFGRLHGIPRDNSTIAWNRSSIA